jgi:hypothetical protein
VKKNQPVSDAYVQRICQRVLARTKIRKKATMLTFALGSFSYCKNGTG